MAGWTAGAAGWTAGAGTGSGLPAGVLRGWGTVMVPGAGALSTPVAEDTATSEGVSPRSAAEARPPGACTADAIVSLAGASGAGASEGRAAGVSATVCWRAGRARPASRWRSGMVADSITSGLVPNESLADRAGSAGRLSSG
ncbi:MAG TPA: hypothetical protein VF933_29840, partial [Streptosporangiaceae bacterium]